MGSDGNGGYDDGYTSVPCFWGLAPGSLVATFLEGHRVDGCRVLDVGAGEGKNAAAFARRGAIVDAIECSRKAISNGRAAFSDVYINWIVTDVEMFDFPVSMYDVVISYGILHCMRTVRVAESVVARTKDATKPGGSYILASFNDGSHDLRAHPHFEPLLLEHSWYLNAFSDWRLVTATNTVLHEMHPHNSIPHHHSVTRLVAERP